jgi:hypothetical protein
MISRVSAAARSGAVEVARRALGLRVKSGFAIVVAVEGDAAAWRVIQCEHVWLTAEGGPFARFPYHPLIELDPEAGAEASRAAVATVRSEAKVQLARLLKQLGPAAAAGVITGSLIDPERIGNPHMRMHAREGQLFREVVADALERAHVPHRVLSDRSCWTQLASQLGMPESQLRAEVSAHGRGIKPWRVDEKLAALGAVGALQASPE